jgi:hypothetical protein
MFGLLFAVGFIGVYLWPLVAIAVVAFFVWCARRVFLRERAAAEAHRREQAELLGASGYRISLDDPRHVDVTGDSAYVVAPATMTFDLRGQQVTQTGSVYAVGLRQVGADWRLTAWAWAKGA